ncbi:cytochrome c [Puniceicoccales bacterium CK1056]|uniref:Cytochrome c n=1 Tax=Oceanipulchritudo coccoides TaxID=2706888 RepID=A0A6B2M7F6_9BACT|nr:cytochrome c [Oceanipulchritudo coccoides]NDV63550.1 cytochrome c [Oceanipulchritudo coccoides]
MKTPFICLVSLMALASVPLVANANSGEELWMKNCKKCHGEDGDGDTVMGKKFSIRDYTDPAVQESITDEDIVAAVTDGLKNEKGKKVMLAFGSKLTEEEISSVAAYVRTLSPE